MAKKILPLNDPIVKSYHYHADLLAVIQDEPNGAEWIMNNYIQLEAPPAMTWACGEFLRIDYYFPYSVWKACPLIYYQRISRKLIKSKWMLITEFLMDSIDLGYYIYLDVNRFFIKNAEAYYSRDDVHDIFVYGYDKEEELIYFFDYMNGNIYMKATAKFNEINDAFSSILEMDEKFIVNGVELIQKGDGNNFKFDISVLETNLNAYLNSVPGQEKNSPDKKLSYNLQNYKYGMSVYDNAILYISKCLRINADYKDTRIMYVLWEHKKVMLLRIKYLGEHGYLKDHEVIFGEYKEIEEKMLIAHNLLLKFFYTEELKLLDRILELMYYIIEKEKILLNKILVNIKNNYKICSCSNVPGHKIFVESQVNNNLILDNCLNINRTHQKIHWSTENKGLTIYANEETTKVFLDKSGMSVLKAFDSSNKNISVCYIKSNSQMLDTNLKNIYPMRGYWFYDSRGFVGDYEDSNCFALSESYTAQDFIYEADIHTVNCSAASLIFRADKNLMGYYCANIDTSGKVKLWRPSHEIAVVSTDINSNGKYKLKINVTGNNIKIYLDNVLRIDVNDDTYSEGYLGFNIFERCAYFQNVYYEEIIL